MRNISEKYENSLREEKKNNEGYTFLIEETFHLLSLYALNNQPKKAKKQFKKIIEYTTAYSFRKDTTLYELIEPLDSIQKVDNKFALVYTKKLLPLNLTVQNNSEDGKGIRWLYISWFKKFLVIDKPLASGFLINQFLKDDFFWKYEFMFINFIKNSANVNPIILNFLYKLQPTFVRNDEVASYYISSFSDNIYTLINIDRNLAKNSLINILSRDLNNSSEQLSDKTIKKLNYLKNTLNVSIKIQKSDKEKATYSTFSEKRLDEKVNKKFYINESLKTKSIDELIEYFDKRDRELDDRDVIFLIQYINEHNDDETTKKLLLPVIERKLVFNNEYYKSIRLLIQKIKCLDEIKVLFLIKIFVLAQDGNFSNFTNKNSLKDAIEIEKSKALHYLAIELEKKFQKIYYYSQSTANLIIAFEYAGLKKKDILAMYQKAFEFIEYRLPNQSDFQWKSIKDSKMHKMSDDEMAIVMILVKMKNLDSSIQKEIILALNYLLNYDEKLLIKPLKWFFDNINYFPHISVASILELFLLYVDDNQEFFQTIKDDFVKVESLENLYIQNKLEELIQRIDDV